MGKVLIHATVTVDGFMADSDGGVDWMFGFESADADTTLVNKVMEEIGHHWGFKQNPDNRRWGNSVRRNAKGAGIPHDPYCS